MHSQSSITIFTDGSSRGNPGPGGFAAVIAASCKLLAVREEKPNQICVVEIGGREEHATNNRMELQAAISAVSFIGKLKAKSYKLVVYTDSSYLLNGITKWIFGWQKNDWKTKAKKDVENRDLWEKLADISKGKDIQWKYVGGHVGVEGNVRCDKIATAFADGLTPKLYHGTLERYGIKNIFDIKHDVVAAKEKSAGRAHQKATAYSYVSMVDGHVETHKTWAECETRVKGKTARYKKVLSADEERQLIQEWNK